MADLVTIATTAVLSQFLGPSAKHLGEQALERGKQIASKATAYLAAVGREPQPVEPKLLLPLVQAASLEADPTLAEKWAALLANAADPARRVAVQPGFAEVLRQLTPTDARTLQVMLSLEDKHSFRVGAAYMIPLLRISERIGASDQELFSISLGNLERLGLTRGVQSQQATAANGGRTSLAALSSLDTDEMFLMPFGRAFMQAVTPPAA